MAGIPSIKQDMSNKPRKSSTPQELEVVTEFLGHIKPARLTRKQDDKKRDQKRKNREQWNFETL